MRRGFTLIELLVVIAIIAILAAILFPVFARARAKAQQNNCLSNVKQLMLGCMMYFSDYDQRTFTYGAIQNGSLVGSPGDGVAAPYAIYPYVKNAQIYLCPINLTNLGANNVPPVGPDWSYLFNQNETAYSYAGHLDRCTYPGEMWLFSERSIGERQTSIGTIRPPCDAYSTNGRLGKPHNDGANVGFLDGHAKWLSYDNGLWTGNGTCSDATAGSDIRRFWRGLD